MRFLRTLLTAPAVACSLAMPPSVTAQSYELPLTDDTFIDAFAPARNSGLATDVFVHNFGPKDGLVRFDTASIAGMSIRQATLRFHLRQIAACGSITFHAVTSPWVETKVTWNIQPRFNPTYTAKVKVCPSDVGEVSVNLTELVQKWADGTAINYGVRLRAEGSIQARIDSAERDGGSPMQLLTATGATDEAIVLDLSTEDNCVIDQPGYYVLNKNWEAREGDSACPTVTIRSEVTLDLRGFSIRGDGGETTPVINIDTSANVTLRNGGLLGVYQAVIAQRITQGPIGDPTVQLDNVHTEGMAFLIDRKALVRDSSFVSRGPYHALLVGRFSRVRDSYLSCATSWCLQGHEGSDIEIRGNRVESSDGGGILVSGPRAILEDNIVLVASPYQRGITVSGENSVVARNTTNRTISGAGSTGSIFDSNICGGLDFQTPGNFYGNNRIKSPGGISGAESQTDLGGNVIY